MAERGRSLDAGGVVRNAGGQRRRSKYRPRAMHRAQAKARPNMPSPRHEGRQGNEGNFWPRDRKNGAASGPYAGFQTCLLICPCRGEGMLAREGILVRSVRKKRAVSGTYHRIAKMPCMGILGHLRRPRAMRSAQGAAPYQPLIFQSGACKATLPIFPPRTVPSRTARQQPSDNKMETSAS